MGWTAGTLEKIIELTEEHLRLLASPALFEVYECFSTLEVRSIPDVAKEIHRSQAAVGVHVEALLKAGFLVEAGTRRKRARTERLFRRTVDEASANFTGKPWSYYEASIDGFAANMRRANRAHQLFKHRLFEDSKEAPFGIYLVRPMRLTREGAKQLGEALRDLHARAAEIEQKHGTDDPSQGERLYMTTMFYPTVASSQSKIKAKRKKAITD